MVRNQTRTGRKRRAVGHPSVGLQMSPPLVSGRAKLELRVFLNYSRNFTASSNRTTLSAIGRPVPPERYCSTPSEQPPNRIPDKKMEPLRRGAPIKECVSEAGYDLRFTVSDPATLPFVVGFPTKTWLGSAGAAGLLMFRSNFTSEPQPAKNVNPSMSPWSTIFHESL
jgi:hypothetical protein